MEYKDATDIVSGLHTALDWVETKVRKSGINRIFWHSVNVKWYTPPVLGGVSWELDEPNRKGYTLILRYWWNKSAVLGFWGKKHYSEDHALLNATIHGRERTSDERDAWNESTPKKGSLIEGIRGFHAFKPSRPTQREDIRFEVFDGQPQLRVRATTDARADG